MAGENEDVDVTLDRPVGVLFLDSEKGVVFIDWCVGAGELTRQVVRDILQKKTILEIADK